MNKNTTLTLENQLFLTPSEIDSQIKRYEPGHDVKKDTSIEWLNTVHMLATTIVEFSELLVISKANPERVGGDTDQISGRIETMKYCTRRLNLIGKQIHKIYTAEEIESELKNRLIENLILKGVG